MPLTATPAAKAATANVGRAVHGQAAILNSIVMSQRLTSRPRLAPS